MAGTQQKEVLKMFQRPSQQRSEEVPIVFETSTRIGGVPPVPNLPLARALPRGSIFSIFSRTHRRAAKELCDLFMSTGSFQELMLVASSVKTVVNEKMFIYALSFTILRKQDMRSLRIPSIVEVFPSLFVPQTTVVQMQEQARTSITGQDAVVTQYGAEFSSTHLKPEHRVAYWREDYGINSHHWHWHLVYPIDMGVERDRKGELFYYMHQQMLARYDMDRLSVGLNRVEKLANWRIKVPDGYFPKLTINNSGRAWGSRQDDTLLSDFQREDFGLERIDISDLEQQHGRVMDAIHQGFLVDREGQKIRLSDEVSPPNKRGIDLLGDAIEADSTFSVNSPFYGDIHNLGHIVISAAHDPDNAHKEELGVMSDTSTAMRDPIFYRWHKYIDDLFQEYKLTQEPYTLEQLSLPSVEVASVEVQKQGGAGQKNQLTTGWNTRDFEASRGLDFGSDMPVMVRLVHLDHHPFTYSIKAVNNDKVTKEVTVRIFMAPKLNERGLPMNFMNQRLLWAEMDRFTHTLKPGSNLIQRDSTSSSITNTTEQTFRDLERQEDPASPENALINFCGCGWPQHMLLPRGKEEGMVFELFVMITDWAQDKVQQRAGARMCANAASFCGILDALYPDSRPMGFPFDRRPMPMLMGRELTNTADLTRLSNIAMQDITVTFTNQKING